MSKIATYLSVMVVCCLGLLSVFAATTRAIADDTDPAALVDALNAVFGKHPGARAGHANGICVKGSFTPTESASVYSKAAHFAGKGPFDVIGRFSMGGGNPTAPNTQKDNVRGLAMHIDIGNGNVTDMVLISAPIFPVRTPAEFLNLLQTVATKDGEKIGAFFKANPGATKQGAWLSARPVPASYAAVNYHGVHTFTLTNGDGLKHIVKWKLVPVGGEVGLRDDEVTEKAVDFYTPELKERLAKGPAEFDLMAVIGIDGDATDDPTVEWPEADRKSINLARIAITALEDNATCDAGMFDPTNVTDGIAGPEKDEIFAIRSPAYAVSLSRRAAP